MTGDLRRCWAARAWLAVLVVLALVAGGCTDDAPPADPEQALVDAVERTFDGAFAYRLVAEADRDALDDLGDALGSVAARLNLFEVSGVVDGPVVSVDVQVFGTAPLAQLRRFGDEEVYLRVATGDGPLGVVATPELEGRLLGIAVQTGQPDSVVGAIGALFDGDWIALDGAFDPSLLTGGTADDEPDDGTGLGTPLPEVVGDYLTVVDGPTGEGDGASEGPTTLRVDLQVRALLRALARLGGGADVAGLEPGALEDGLGLLPEQVTGDVVLDGDVVSAIVFDVAEAAREAGEQVDGSLELRLELTDQGEPDLPAVPDAAARVPSAELAAGLSALLATPVPAPTERPGTGEPATPAPRSDSEHPSDPS